MNETLIIGGCGYIGSRLSEEIRSDVMDIELFGTSSVKSNIKIDYGEITTKFFQKYTTIVLLAGHSSVSMATNDPLGAYHNNIVNFQRLIANIPDSTKLIYASSSSVYNGMLNASEGILLGRSTNIYDYTKFYIDHIVKNDYSKRKIYGLRFGTVNGFSNNFRPELMINKMYCDAATLGKIEIYGPSILRPILDIEDLIYAVKCIINQDVLPGIYNVSSFNATVEEIASQVSKIVGVPVEIMGESNGYNFSMQNDKLQNESDWRPIGSIASIVVGMMGMINFGKPRDIVSNYKQLQMLWKP